MDFFLRNTKTCGYKMFKYMITEYPKIFSYLSVIPSHFCLYNYEFFVM